MSPQLRDYLRRQREKADKDLKARCRQVEAAYERFQVQRAERIACMPLTEQTPRPEPPKPLFEPIAPARKPPSLTPLTELDAMIKAGWGDTPREEIPADWKTRKGPGNLIPHRGPPSRKERQPAIMREHYGKAS